METNESTSNVAATPPAPAPVEYQNMSNVAASLLAAHILIHIHVPARESICALRAERQRGRINLLHARLVNAKWLEAGNDAWLRTQGQPFWRTLLTDSIPFRHTVGQSPAEPEVPAVQEAACRKHVSTSGRSRPADPKVPWQPIRHRDHNDREGLVRQI